MKKLLLLIPLCALLMINTHAQDLPLREIPDAPESYTAGNVLGRLVEGFGFRYYWASEGLRAEDLDYKPSKDARSCIETLQHILNLSEGVLYTSKGEAIKNTRDFDKLSYQDIRKQTLENLSNAAQNFRSKSDEEIASLKIQFGRAGSNGFDLWYLINGQISDGIYHTGQLVTFRRSSGNPINSKISVFRGKVRD
ncbi:MAG: hypothetical protein MRZ79_22180 [Bacteroidia bacterium]|nr:hypothetical protein [Bacteroidia bacterium]